MMRDAARAPNFCHTVLGIATQSAAVVLCSRDLRRGELAAKELDPEGMRIVACQLEVDNSVSVASMAEWVKNRFGRTDVLVHNAGIYINKPVESVSEREYDEIMDINMKGAFLTTKFAIPGMVKRKRGAIVNVASDSGLVGTAGSSVYCASKGAMVLFTKAVALDHAKDGIRVNVICPGEVTTPMLERDAAESGRGFEEYYQRLAAPIPMKRAATAEEIARGILFLASDESSFMTGSALSVDGGSTAL